MLAITKNAAEGKAAKPIVYARGTLELTDQPVLHGVFDNVSRSLQAEFFEDMRAVSLHGAGG